MTCKIKSVFYKRMYNIFMATNIFDRNQYYNAFTKSILYGEMFGVKIITIIQLGMNF